MLPRKEAGHFQQEGWEEWLSSISSGLSQAWDKGLSGQALSLVLHHPQHHIILTTALKAEPQPTLEETEAGGEGAAPDSGFRLKSHEPGLGASFALYLLEPRATLFSTQLECGLSLPKLMWIFNPHNQAVRSRNRRDLYEVISALSSGMD